MRSKRFEALAKRPVNQDGFVKEWIEEGFIAMESPNDPKPSIKIVNGVVTELDGKPANQFASASDAMVWSSAMSSRDKRTLFPFGCVQSKTTWA